MSAIESTNLSPAKRNQKGKLIGTRQKTIIINLYKTKLQNKSDMKYKDLMQELSNKTGIGLRSIKNTIAEYKRSGVVASPNRKKIRLNIHDKIDDFDKNAIRQKIHQFWFRRELPTLKKIVVALKEDPNLPTLPRTSLQRILKELNFEYTKRSLSSALIERGDLVIWRQKYILDIRKYRSEGRTIYYLDETWLNAEECTTKVWVDKSVESHRDAFLQGLSTGPKNPTGKGKWLIVVHIGSSEGFVEGGLLCFESKRNTSENHDEMNGDSFLEWFKGFLPLLNDNAIIVMDNASYHSVKKDPIPTMSWKKDNIVKWLTSKNVVFDTSMVKFRFMELVNKIRPAYDKYVIDELAKEQNKLVLRLPPYHCELNPIELAWSVVKNHVKINNSTFKLDDVRKLLIQGVEKVTPVMWANFVSHTIKEEDKLFQIDSISDDMLDELQPAESHSFAITGDTTSDYSDDSD